MINRRSLLIAGATLVAGPALVRASSLMPLRGYSISRVTVRISAKGFLRDDEDWRPFLKGGHVLELPGVSTCISLSPGRSVERVLFERINKYHLDSEIVRANLMEKAKSLMQSPHIAGFDVKTINDQDLPVGGRQWSVSDAFMSPFAFMPPLLLTPR